VTPRPARAAAPAGAVVVLGSGLEGGAVSDVLAGRLDHAAALHRAGAAAGRPPLLVLSGGAAADGGPTEAAAMAAALARLGVPADDLVLEDRSTTTEENLRFAAELLARRRVPPPFAVVTSDFHAARVAVLARRLGLRVRVQTAATPLARRIPALLRELRLLVGPVAASAADAVLGRLPRRRTRRR
jgi:uncharacterized SAM-binding protein YcdF (DUF218 family)